ncbi:hypothetical protein ACKFKG_31290 [Phormidesmis sp. 146-35]
MNKMLWLAGLGVAIALGSCGKQDRAQIQKSPDAVPVTQAPQNFPKPTVSANAPMPTIAVKGMIQSTSAQTRLSRLSTANRRDPFAAVLPPEIKMGAVKNQPAARRSVSSQVQRPTVKPATQAPQIALTPLPPSSLPALPPVAVNSAPPLSNVPVLPPVSRTSLADAIEITGVIQVGGKVTAIVQSPTESTARYVQPGEYLANGSVLLKRIIMSKNGEPTIVLQQNGVEVTKSIGSTRVASAS